MKLKNIAAATVAVASLIGLAGCSNNAGKTADGKTQVVVWHNSTTGDGKKFWESAAADFMKKNPQVSVKVEAIQNEDLDGKLQTALQDPQSAPDVFLSRGGQKLQDMVEAGQVKDLTGKLSDDVKTGMKAALASQTLEGKVYGMPIAALPGGIWYSKDLFKQAGIEKTPTTWDEFTQVIDKLKAANITPIALGGKDAWPAAHWYYWFALRECPAKAFEAAQTEKKFDNSCWLKAGEDVNKLKDLNAFNKGFLTTPAQQGASSSAGLIANHMAAMELMGGWDPGVIRDLTPDKKDLADLGFFAFPQLDGQKGNPKAIMGGTDAMAVGESAPDEAVDFLNFIAQKEYQEKYAQAFSTIPAAQYAQDIVENPALLEVLPVYKESSSVSLWLDTVLGQNVGNALNEGVVNLLADKGTAQDILKSVQSAAQKG